MIPNLPGVPPMAKYAINLLPSRLLSGVSSILQLLSLDPIWGIFDQENVNVLNPDTVVNLTVRAESDISDFPVEAGGFASYNKVQKPDTHKVRMAKSGSKDDRAKFLTTLDTLKKSLALYSVVTPEKTYSKVNIIGYDYARESGQGANMIVADISFKEIREVTPIYATKATADTVKNPASADAVTSGEAKPSSEGAVTTDSGKSADTTAQAENNTVMDNKYSSVKESPATAATATEPALPAGQSYDPVTGAVVDSKSGVVNETATRGDIDPVSGEKWKVSPVAGTVNGKGSLP